MGTQPSTASQSLTDDFLEHWSLLFAIAYRMLGTVMDAEDMVQDTFLKWQTVSKSQVRSAKSYLTTIITRLCIDRLRSAQVQREQYIGPWLPEPIVTAFSADPHYQVEQADSLTMAFLVMLERLSPIERAVFLLREIFDYDYDEIAPIVEKSTVNCRQIARRARQQVTKPRSRFSASPEQHHQLTLKFMQACQQGEMEDLLHCLADDITLWSDGGGQVTAALKPIQGSVKVSGFLRAIYRYQRKLGFIPDLELVQVNGQTGIQFSIAGQVETIAVLETTDQQIISIFFIRNPQKLRIEQIHHSSILD
ncbi:RNA polymerase sigma-70 factor [Acaryochloris sp. CCMEE 5410]|uniref:RNA polymerase sigma-70 factor n=1 Tax=Acaryochloris sp. CCMEE 5410 TaxID=310037 RepID=UPI0002484BC7|nr:RNA polymerase sigma-70 factor [Acaryochloris sp. CCMEE 5410]KAI9130338.1 RNA polymerase sigma-70 factor [Acaryochloris sp. CCMEE 5410]